MQDLGRYTKREHVEIQARYVSFLIVGSVALVCLVFTLGVLLGSRQVRRAVCPLPDPLAELDSKTNEPSPPPTSQRVNLSFHESLVKESGQVPTPASLILKQPSPKLGAEETNKFSLKTTDKAPRVKPRLEEPPIPETVRNDEPGYYSLQVGSFQRRRDANEMSRKLKRAGHTVFLVSVNMPERGGFWYRVRVGPFNSKNAAWLYKKQFEERERIPAFVVKRRAKS